ncbi:MAG: hypothetical protein NTV95_02460 [Candidatus Saccharibacteria bacterium]|nr:hypothetical protein [Candidatus Saccharibacteria bacterium]
MNTSRDNIKQAFFWLMPNGIEILIYIFIAGATLILSGVDRLKDLLFVSGDFNPIRLGISGIDILLTRLVGEKLAGTLSLAIFWALVGVVVNLIWWAGSNVTTEINEDLEFSKYVHPSGVDPQSQIQDYSKKIALRTAVAVIGLLYFNFFISAGLPYVNQRYSKVINSWSTNKDFKTLLIAVTIEILLLHVFVVLTRVMLLRKRVFSR